MNNYNFRIPTCANIAFGNKDSWLNDWHSLDMMLQMEDTFNFRWVEHYTMLTLLSDIAIRLREIGLEYNGFDWFTTQGGGSERL